MKTRQKILLTARNLFNEQHFGRVTTAALAEAVGIAEGNLWYHFKSKRALLDALTEDFIEQAQGRLALRPAEGSSILNDYTSMLNALASEQRQYRFLYRDQADYGEHTDVLIDALPRIYADTFDQFRAFFDAMAQAGHFIDPTKDREDLISASILVIRYHLEFQREMGNDATKGSGVVQGALLLHLSMLAPHLRASALNALHKELEAQRADVA